MRMPHLPYYSTLKKFWNGFFQTFQAGLLFFSGGQVNMNIDSHTKTVSLGVVNLIQSWQFLQKILCGDHKLQRFVALAMVLCKLQQSTGSVFTIYQHF